jgi:NADPH:quinone reductase
VDIILEMLANVNLSSDTKLLANNGRVIVIGSRGEVTINPRELMSRRASIRAFTLWAISANLARHRCWVRKSRRSPSTQN